MCDMGIHEVTSLGAAWREDDSAGAKASKPWTRRIHSLQWSMLSRIQVPKQRHSINLHLLCCPQTDLGRSHSVRGSSTPVMSSKRSHGAEQPAVKARHVPLSTATTISPEGTAWAGCTCSQGSTLQRL